MLKKVKDSNGLKALQKTISFLDTDIKSRDYFRVHDFPETFFVGKNSFRISGNSELLVNSALIYIDLVDSNGNIVYHEILDVVNSDKSRTVVVYIYPDAPPGEIKCYIASRTKFHPLNGIKIPFDADDPLSDVYKNIPNIMWIGTSIIIPNKQNNSEVYFESDPIVTYSERLAKYDIPQTSSRYTEYKAQSTASVSIQSKTSPFQYSDSRLVKGSTDTENIFQIIPNVTNNSGESSQNLRLPEFSDSNILRSNSDIFTDAMVGGTIVVKNILPTQDIPKDAVSTSSFSIPDYSASILRIINAKTIEVSKPFIFKSTYTSTNTGERDIIFNSFISQTNFTCSYYATTDVNVTQSRRYESFVSMEIENMEPLIGAVDAISVSYKPVGSFGDFTDVGVFTCREQNILVDTQSLELSSDFGLKETEIGILRSQANVNSYWTSSKSGVVSESLSYDSTKIANGLYVSYSGSMLSDQYVSVYPKDSFIANATQNTEYKLEFSAYSVDDNTGWTSPLLDVYISGSNIEQDIIKKTDNQSILKNRLFGEFIGSISSKDGKLSDNTFHFKVISGESIKPVFVIRSGKWALGKITLSPRKEIGFTPNYYKINIPMTEFKRSSELILNIKYLNSDGVTANVDTKLYGVYFSGSTQLYFDELNGIPSGLISSSNQLPSGVVSSSQQVKDFLPSGTVSSSQQVRDYLPSNLVSSSQQVKDFLPSGVISSSNQFPANIVSSSQQVKDFLPVGSVSSSTQIVGGPSRAIQFNWSGSLTGSSDLFYDPITKLLSVGISEGTYAEQRYQSNFTIRNSSNNNDNYYFTLEKSASNSQSSPVFVIKKDYNNSGSSIGIGVTTPKSSLDVIVRKDNSSTTLQSIAASNSGSGITFTIASSSDVTPPSTSYFKLFNVASETTASSNKIGVFANADINGRSYITIGLENSGSQGITNSDTTWVVIGSGSIYSKEFSGSGYNLNNIDFNKIVNKPSIFSGSGQIDYDGLLNKPSVTNTGSGYLLVNNNNPSQSYGVKNIYHTSSYATASNAIPTAIDQFHLANGAQLIMCTTSSIAGVNHKAFTRELVYEATISFSSAVTTNLRIPIPLYAFNTNFYTGSNYNMGMAYTAETIIFATTGANGSIGAYTWASTAQGRAHVATGGSGRLVMYGQHAVSGGLDVAMGKFGYSPPAYSAYDSRYTVSVVSSSTDLNIQHSLTAPTANSTWDGHLIMKVHQLVYEVYIGS
jgi:hypothetical protein